MTSEGLELFYSEGDEPLYPERLDAFFTDIEPTDTFNIHVQDAKNPAAAIAFRIGRFRDALRLAENAIGLTAFNGAILAALLAAHPEAVESLPEEMQAQARELAGRIKPTPQANENQA